MSIWLHYIVDLNIITEKRLFFCKLQQDKIVKCSSFSKIFIVDASSAVYDVTMLWGLQSVNIYDFDSDKLIHAYIGILLLYLHF